MDDLNLISTKATKIPLLNLEAKEVAAGAQPAYAPKGAAFCNPGVGKQNFFQHDMDDQSWCKWKSDLQAGMATDDDDIPMRELRKIFKMIEPKLVTILEAWNSGTETLNEWLENIMIMSYTIKHCRVFHDYQINILLSYRLITGRVATVEMSRYISRTLFGEVQSSNFEEAISVIRNMFDYANCVTECEMSKRMVKLYSFLLTQGYLKSLGITLSDEDYSKVEQRALLSAFSSKKSFLLCVVDTCLFICERVIEWRKCGEFSVFMKSGKIFDEWNKEADRLINLAPFTGNLAPHGTSYFSFIADLRDVVEKGEAMLKFMRARSGEDSKFVAMKLSKLQFISNTEITKRSSQMERKAPFGVLIHGGSSVAKTSFAKMLFYYYGALRDLEHTDDFRFVRSPTDDFWTNCDSSKWCIQFDDLAFLHPKNGEMEPGMRDMIHVSGNTPFNPPQAALEDKGKTPILAELVTVTTNCIDLNAWEFFWCPLAVRRRLPFVVTVEPKPEYSHLNGHFIDPAKLKPVDGKFPDYWIIKLMKVVPEMRDDRQNASLEEVKTFHNVDEFLQHFGKAALEHVKHQTAALVQDNNMKTIEVCKTCLAPLPHDNCVVLQSRDVSDVVDYAWKHILIFLFFLPYLPGFSFYTILSWFWRGWLAFIFQCVVLIYLYFPFEWASTFCDNFLEACASRKTTLWILSYVSQYKVGRRVVMLLANRMESEDSHRAFVNSLITVKSDRRLIGIVTGLGLLSVALYGYGKYVAAHQTDKVDATVEIPRGESQQEGNLTVQGAESDQFEKESSKNVWYNPAVALTSFDVPQASTSLVGMSDDGIRALMHRNCVLLHIRGRGDNQKRIIRGVMLVGHKCLTNAHAFRNGFDWYTVTIIQNSINGAISSNMSFDIHIDMVARSTTSDVCIFDVECLPAFRDVMKYWAETDFRPQSCLQIYRSDEGSTVEKRNVYNLQFMPQLPVEELGKSCNVYMGICDVNTAIGDCGAMCVASTGRGPYIFGIHMLGRERQAGVLSIKKSEIENLLKHDAISKRPIVQAGFAPFMEVESRKHVLGPLHHRSMIRYIQKGVVGVHGSFLGFRPKPKSKVRATPLQGEFLAHYGTQVAYCEPAMKGWKPWKINLEAMIQPRSIFDRRLLREAGREFAKDCISGLQSKDFSELVILSDRAAINGLPGVKHLDKINENSSMGFPWNKTKKGFLIPAPDEEYPEGIDFMPEVWEKVRDIEASYKNGERVYPIFVGCLKDEATKLSKAREERTRLFMGSSIAWNIVVRKYALTFARLVQRNRELFECSVGLPAQSAEWGDLRKYLTKFGLSRMVAGDYKNFDKQMLAEFILEAFGIIVEIYREARASEEHLRILMCIGEDISFAMCNINGDLFEIFGGNPSGHPLTVIINSLVNVLYLRYAYRVLNPAEEVGSFKKNVALTTYGDDNVFGVSVDAPWFNHTTLQEVLADIGLTYTMADKTSESVPYIHIDDVSFLKRSWRYDENVGHFLCPLEEESIIKSLTVWVPSESLDQPSHMIAVITSANDEYFFYGKEIFEEKHCFFNEVLKEEPYCFYVATKPLSTYDQLVERFLGPMAHVALTSDTECETKLPHILNKELCERTTEAATCGSGNVETITKSIVPPFGYEVTHWEQFKTLQVQSADISDLPVSGGLETSEVVTFVDDSTGQIDNTVYAHSSIASSGGTLNTSLEHFLRRPTLIDSRSWTTASSNGVLGSIIEPWFLFLNNGVIRNKLNNYAFLRAKLCIKVVINATPFHFGSMRIAYEPSVNVAGTGHRTTKIRSNPVSTLPLITPYSQLPGVWVLPSDNSGGEIHVPFFRHSNWLPLKTANDVRSMGTLTYYVAFPLTVASATGSSSISISTFAWLEDVELGGATAELTLQARDEYDGAISAPARAIATAASALSNLPVIGKFAKATSIGAGALASMASLFGFTNAPVIDNVHAFVPVTGVHLASSEIGTPVQKLTLDPKQELSIDPSMHGLGGEDQMSIDYVAKQKSTLVMDGWSTSDAVNTVIFNSRVSPMLFGSVNILDAGLVTRSVRVYHSSMSYIGMMFTHWKGDIIFEVEVICTKFHKGRLKIAWDPIGTVGTMALPENTVYTTILDIGENNKATFRVPFHQALAWLRTRGVSADNWTPGNSLASDPEYDNGMLIVSVLTPLMSPVAPQNVGIKVSVYSASVEFANPRSFLGEASNSSPPSFFAVQAKDEVDVVSSVVTLGDNGVMHPERYSLNFGEHIASLRALLHRYSLYDTTSFPPDSATRTALLRKSFSRHPPMFGFDPQGWTSMNKTLTAGTAFGNMTPTHPITYVEMMYGASTGGVNFIVNSSADLYPYIGDIRIQRLTDTARSGERAGAVAASINAGTSNGAYNRFMNMSVPSGGTAGAAFTNSQTNGSLNWNYPMMTNVNFNYTDPTSYLLGNPADATNRECVVLEAYVKQATASTVTPLVSFTSYAATGVDFNCLWWLCCPTIDYYTAIPSTP